MHRTNYIYIYLHIHKGTIAIILTWEVTVISGQIQILGYRIIYYYIICACAQLQYRSETCIHTCVGGFLLGPRALFLLT